jgi:hypothetical protein
MPWLFAGGLENFVSLAGGIIGAVSDLFVCSVDRVLSGLIVVGSRGSCKFCWFTKPGYPLELSEYGLDWWSISMSF